MIQDSISSVSLNPVEINSTVEKEDEVTFIKGLCTFTTTAFVMKPGYIKAAFQTTSNALDLSKLS